MTAERLPYKKCPLCESGDFSQLREASWLHHPLAGELWRYVTEGRLPEKIQWMRCEACDHVFTSGTFTNKQMELLMSAVQSGQVPGANIEQFRAVTGRIIDRIVDTFSHTGGGVWRPAGAWWLDFGFGSGALMMTAAEYGFHVEGVEARKDSVEKMRSFGFIANHMRPQVAREYSVISMADVLEHVRDPKAMLRQAHQILLPQGLLFISCPNTQSAPWRLLDKQGINPYWGEIEHYHNFSRQRLVELLFDCGFEPLTYSVSERYRACMEIIARKV